MSSSLKGVDYSKALSKSMGFIVELSRLRNEVGTDIDNKEKIRQIIRNLKELSDLDGRLGRYDELDLELYELHSWLDKIGEHEEADRYSRVNRAFIVSRYQTLNGDYGKPYYKAEP